MGTLTPIKILRYTTVLWAKIRPSQRGFVLIMETKIYLLLGFIAGKVVPTVQLVWPLGLRGAFIILQLFPQCMPGVLLRGFIVLLVLSLCTIQLYSWV